MCVRGNVLPSCGLTNTMNRRGVAAVAAVTVAGVTLYPQNIVTVSLAVER